MKTTPTTEGIRIQASTAKENPIVAVIVELLQLVPTVSAEERARHSVQVNAGETWRNWVEIPSRLYYGPLRRLADGE